jgi:hypothetical protein
MVGLKETPQKSLSVPQDAGFGCVEVRQECAVRVMLEE